MNESFEDVAAKIAAKQGSKEVCPECGAPIDDPDAEYCPQCGAQLDQDEVAEKKSKADADEDDGEHEDDDVRESADQPLQAPVSNDNPRPGASSKPPLRCQQCGTFTRDDWRFCTSCGANLLKQTSALAKGQTEQDQLEQQLHQYLRLHGLVMVEAGSPEVSQTSGYGANFGYDTYTNRDGQEGQAAGRSNNLSQSMPSPHPLPVGILSAAVAGLGQAARMVEVDSVSRNLPLVRAMTMQVRHVAQQALVSCGLAEFTAANGENGITWPERTGGEVDESQLSWQVLPPTRTVRLTTAVRSQADQALPLQRA